MPLRTSIVTSTVSLLCAAALSALCAHACSASGKNTLGGEGQGAGNGTGGEGIGGGNLGGSGVGGACAGQIYPGQLVPLDLYIMQDKSASMADDGKWDSTTAALTTFLNSDQGAGLGVGIQYFPVPPTGTIPSACTTDAQCGLYGPCLPGFNMCGGSYAPDTSCDPADYAPPSVGIDDLTVNKQAILTSLGAQSPDGDATPTQPSIEGALTYATAWAAAHLAHLTYILYATDGDPTGCTYNDPAVAATKLAAAAAAFPPVKTFVIGVGLSTDTLNQLATAGGTGQAFLVDTGSGATQQFLDTLNQIRASGMCMFQIPVPDGGTPDYTHVNVEFVNPADPQDTETVIYVAVEGACDPVNGGWYYDDVNNPHIILLCQASCDKHRLNGWDTTVKLGCQTITY